MAVIYVNDDGDNSTGASWATAYTSMDNASVDGAAAGSDIWIGHDHAETFGSNTTLNFSNGTAANPIRLFSVNTGTDAYSPSARPKLTTGFVDLYLQGHTRWFGVDFECNDCIIGTSDMTMEFVDCNWTANNSAQWTIGFTNGDGLSVKIQGGSVDLSGGSSFTDMSILDGVFAEFIDVAFTEHSGQTSWITGVTSTVEGATVIARGCDLSGYDNLFTTAVDQRWYASIRGCKLKSGYSVAATVPVFGKSKMIVENSAVGTISAPAPGLNNCLTESGETKNDTARYRTGGASDGETAHSWQMVSTAIAIEQFKALESPPMTVWTDDDSGGAVTLTVYVASGATLNDDDFWIEVSSPNEIASPNQTAQGQYNTTRMAPLGTPAALTTDSGSTWNGTGVGTKQEIAVTINPTEPGPVTIRCFLAKPSTTVYVDPKPELT